MKTSTSSRRAATSSSVSSVTPRCDLASLIGGLEALAGDVEHDVAVHLHEAPVGVPGEALVARARRQTLHRLVVEPEVEDGVEHARHRLARTGAHRDEQRVLGIAQPLAGVLLQARQRLGDLLGEAVRQVAIGAHVGDAGLGRDREARRDAVGAQHPRHLGHVGALAAEQVAHVPRPLGEVVDPLRRRGGAHAVRDPTRARWSRGGPPRPRAAAPPRGARRSPRPPARPGAGRARAPAGPAASGLPSASTMKRWASSSSAKAPASQAPQTTPPAAPEKPLRCSRSPQAAQAASCGARPAASSSFSRNASWLATVAWARPSASSSASSWHSRLKTSGCGSPSSNRRVTASQARLALSSAAASAAQARVALDRLGPRDGQQVAAPLVEHELDAEERLQAPAEAAARAPHALGDRAELAAMRGVEVQDAVGLAVAHRAQDDRLRLQRMAGHRLDGHRYTL